MATTDEGKAMEGASPLVPHKFEALTKILINELDIVCGEDIIDICEQYHLALETVAELCHTDPHFSHILTGTGFEGLPILFHLRETDSANALLHFAQPQPIQKSLHVHRHSVVLQDSQTHWKKKCPLLFYVSPGPCTEPDRIKIYLSARTHSHLLKGAFGMPFSDSSTRVLPDKYHSFKFYLSSNGFLNSFEEQRSNFLCSYKPILGTVQRHEIGEEHDQQEHNLHGILQVDNPNEQDSETYAIKNVPALFCPDWPEQAMAWTSRKRPSGWPSRTLVQEVIIKGCHVIPASMSKKTDADPTSIEEDCEWVLCFDVAEKHLFRSLGIQDKQVAFLFRSLVCDRHSLHRGLITMDHINAVLLWAFQDAKATNADGQVLGLLDRFLQVSSKFMEFLSSGRCRHFFIPEKNLFASIPEYELENIRDMVDGLLVQPWTFLLHCHLLPYVFYHDRNRTETLFFTDERKKDVLEGQRIQRFTSWAANLSVNIIPQIQQSLVKAFGDNIKLFVLTSCSRMNQYSLCECIVLHRDIFRILEEDNLEKTYQEPFTSILKSNLGCLYHVNSMSAEGIRAKHYFLDKAEALFKDSQDMDISLGRMRLANLFFNTQRYPEAIAELEEVIQRLTSSAIREASEDNEELANNVPLLRNDCGKDLKMSVMARKMKQKLWWRWLTRSYTFDIVYSKILRPLCPSAMKGCLSLAMCTALGVQSHSAAIFSPNFHTRFLMALCYLNMRGENKGLSILHGMESVLTDPNLPNVVETSIYSELTEKRMAGYLVILGNCYLLAGAREKAKAMYQRSMKIFPTPRNSAGWLYLTVQYGDTWRGIQQGAKVLAAASALSLLFSFIHSHI